MELENDISYIELEAFISKIIADLNSEKDGEKAGQTLSELLDRLEILSNRDFETVATFAFNLYDTIIRCGQLESSATEFFVTELNVFLAFVSRKAKMERAKRNDAISKSIDKLIPLVGNLFREDEYIKGDETDKLYSKAIYFGTKFGCPIDMKKANHPGVIKEILRFVSKEITSCVSSETDQLADDVKNWLDFTLGRYRYIAKVMDFAEAVYIMDQVNPN